MIEIKHLCTCMDGRYYCDKSTSTCPNKETRNHIYPACNCGKGVNCDFSEAHCKLTPKKLEQVNHPLHYGGPTYIYEAIKVIEAWKLDFCLGNTVKYISRAGKKHPAKELEDLEKAAWYLNRRIEQLKGIK